MSNPEDGGVRYIRVVGEFADDAEHKPAILFGIAQDVTEQRLAQDALHQSEAEYRALRKYD
ncbi:MAG: hypothetical protein IPK16_14230 [Anaerolineales bacterium]|nr:hypothetical protein [Anaerolineales bacterium]